MVKGRVHTLLEFAFRSFAVNTSEKFVQYFWYLALKETFTTSYAGKRNWYGLIAENVSGRAIS